jgi:hypothetical protein
VETTGEYKHKITNGGGNSATTIMPVSKPMTFQPDTECWRR